jgi:predicted nucleic acid-binding protein
VRPLKNGNSSLARDYQDALQSRRGLTVLPVSRDVLVEAAHLRATTTLRLPDAIHAASARLGGCGRFVTNDARFRTVLDLGVVLLPDLITPCP